MSYTIIFDDINKNKLHNLYLFHGPEEYVKRQALSELSQVVVSQEYRDLNYMVIDGETADSDDIIASCETLPFLSDKRLVVVMDYAGFGNKKFDKDDKLADYFSNIPDTTCLVLYNRGDINKSSSLYKKAKKAGKAVCFDRLDSGELTRWAKGKFNKAGKMISTRDLRHFLLLTGNDLETVNNEIQKLVNYMGDDKTITRDVIDSLITPVPEHTIFQLIDMVATRKSGKALEFLNELIDKGEPVLVIISMIAKHVRNMIYYKYFTELGYNQDVICKKLEVHPYVIKKCSNQSGSFTIDKLKEVYNECLKLNYDIKTGMVRDRLGLELLILNMCS